MCKILFSENGSTVCIVDALKLEDAIQFALNLHRSSNIKHYIIVEKDDDEAKLKHTILLLESK